MDYDDLLLAIRREADITGADTVYVLGAEAMLASFPFNPAMPDRPAAADFPHMKSHADVVTHLDSFFVRLFDFSDPSGIVADGVGTATAVLPEGWEQRAIAVRQPGIQAVGLCLDPADICVSKLATAMFEGEWKDERRTDHIAFVEELMDVELVWAQVLLDRVDLLADGQRYDGGPVVDQPFRDRMRTWINGAELRRIYN